MEKQEFLKLIDRYLEGNASEEDKQLLYNYYNSFQGNDTWDTALGDPEPVTAEIWQRILTSIAAEQAPVRAINHWKRWMIAASILVIAGIGGYFAFFNNGTEKPVVKLQPQVHDVPAPSANRAMITLANGEKVFLDSTGNGTLGMQGSVKISKQQDGSIIYENTGRNTSIGYNTIINPRGSRVQTLALADGTQVWLNAGSSLRYPTAFTGNERKVELTGEAYFAVIHNEQMPFKVIANGVEIKDLGTEFNVNSYTDEPEVKVTLVSGLLEVKNGGTDKQLMPGQQARVSDIIKLVKNADIPAELAWKNGFFSFREADITTVMRQVSRWYDIEVGYAGEIYQGTFSGRIGQDLSLKDLLDGLSGMKLKFRIEGNRLVIL